MRLQSAALAIGFAGLCMSVGALPVCAQEHASYIFYRDGKPVGRHVVESSGQGAGLRVRVETQIQVQLADRITLFRYSHRASETWDGDRLVSMESQTDDNGKNFRVIANRGGSGLAIRATVPDVEAASIGDRMLSFQAFGTSEKLVEQVAPADLVPTNWWHHRIVRQTRLLNSQTGSISTIAIQQLGNEVVQTGLGQLAASRYRMTGVVTQDLWYDGRGRWIKSSFRARDGSAVELVRER
jgi:hypothetical protein